MTLKFPKTASVSWIGYLGTSSKQVFSKLALKHVIGVRVTNFTIKLTMAAQEVSVMIIRYPRKGNKHS